MGLIRQDGSKLGSGGSWPRSHAEVPDNRLCLFGIILYSAACGYNIHIPIIPSYSNEIQRKTK